MPDLMDGVEAAIRAYILDKMPEDPSGQLAAGGFQDLLQSFETWRSRRIRAQARVCHFSTAIQGSAKAAEHKDALDLIVSKIERGDDLLPHLSTRIDTPSTVDRMLADLGIFHLHLSTELKDGGRWMKRSGDLLFAAFKANDAYFVGIYDHKTDWASRRILETIAENWPDAGILHKSNFVVGLTNDPTDDVERLKLQAAGISTGQIQTSEGVFMTVGQGLAGEPYSAARFRMIVVDRLRIWREDIDERLVAAAADVDAAAGRQVTGDWTPFVHEERAGLLREDVFYPIVDLFLA